MKKIKVGSDFSGVGAFDFALKNITNDFENVFACDLDKYARISYLANHEAPKNYPFDVYEREIPSESLDIYMTSPPCQGFSMAGSRKGSILFFNSLEFIQKNKPRFFIFENVEGLLSHERKKDSNSEFGRTFQEWINHLGGKSVNGLPTIFPFEDSVEYHIYFKVLNSKKYGVPQNRKRVFIVGIRDDEDNEFSFPKEEHLKVFAKDLLEKQVDKRYFLSEKAIKGFLKTNGNHEEKGNGFKFEPIDINKPFRAITTCAGSRGTDNFVISYTRDAKGKVVSNHFNNHFNNYFNTIHTCTGGGGNTDQFIKQENLQIRKITPLECFRAQSFPDEFVQKSIEAGVSDTQLFKQAGNSITVRVLELILRQLKIFK